LSLQLALKSDKHFELLQKLFRTFFHVFFLFQIPFEGPANIRLEIVEHLLVTHGPVEVDVRLLKVLSG
jgi:hypothetical protein